MRQIILRRFCPTSFTLDSGQSLQVKCGRCILNECACTCTLLQGLKLHSSVTKFYILFTRKCERKNWIGVATKQHTSVTLPLRLGSAPQAHRTLRWAASRLTMWERFQDLLTDHHLLLLHVDTKRYLGTGGNAQTSVVDSANRERKRPPLLSGQESH